MSHAGSQTREDPVRAREREVEGHIDHGHSVAGWSATALGLLGSGVASVAMVFAWVGIFWVGIVIMLLGLPVGYVLGRAEKRKQGHSQGHGHGDAKGPR